MTPAIAYGRHAAADLDLAGRVLPGTVGVDGSQGESHAALFFELWLTADFLKAFQFYHKGGNNSLLSLFIRDGA